MIIVAGWLRVEPSQRAEYVDGCRAVIEAARSAPGCIDFSISADLLDDTRINVFEHWETVDDVERFRGSGPDDSQQDVIVGAHVLQHTIAETISLTG